VSARQRCVAALLVCLSGTAWADGGVALSAAVDAALRGAPELADARLTVTEAAADASEADAAFDLRLDADWSFSESFAPVYVTSLASSRTLRLRDTSLDQSVTRRFSTGTEVAVEYLSLTESVLGEATDFSLTRETARLRLSQSILRGRSQAANLAPLRAAEQRGEAARLGVRARAAEVIRGVEVAYWELAYAQREVAIEERALDATRRHLDDTRRRVRAGRVAPADLLVVERAVAVAADELVAADGRRRTRALELARLTGLDTPSLQARDWPGPGTTLHPEALLAAVRTAPLPRAADALAEARRQEARAQDDRTLPRLDLVGSIGPSGERPTVGDALRAMASFDETAWSVGMVFSWTPGGSSQEAARARADAQRLRAELGREIAQRDLEDRARKLLAQLDGAVRRSELSQKAVELARRALAAEQGRFDAGVVPAKNLLDRQMELAQAELRAARVESDAAVARAELGGLTGENLARFGVR
jgi:HAE1 family hydrophobic/amphiphilic exporter-1